MQVMTAEQPLVKLDVAQARNELAIIPPQELQIQVQSGVPQLPPELITRADQFLDAIQNYNPSDPQQVEFQRRAAAAVDAFGEGAQREAARIAESPILDQSLQRLAARGEDGGDVAQSLVALNRQVAELDPSQIDLSRPGGVKRLLRFLPGFGDTIADYFTKYQSANAVLKEILQSMINGREQLARDNAILAMDQTKMRAMTFQLQDQILLGLYLDAKLEGMLQSAIGPDDTRHKFVAEELLFPLRQRVQDLQQQLAVNQQGVLVYEIIIRNNKELIKGVKRAEMTTLTALKIAVAASMALGNQALVLDILQTVNATTSGLIEHTSQLLRNQGAQIQKQASSASLDIEALKRPFQNVNAAIDDISRYRTDALQTLRANIDDMAQINDHARQSIERMEKANQLAPLIDFEVRAAK